MKKYRYKDLLDGKFNFRTTSLLVALLLTTFNLNAFAQNTASLAETATRETRQTELIEKEDVQETSSMNLAAPELITTTTYAFLAQSGVALDDMSTGTTQIVAPGVDDTASAVTNTGFDFWYDGVRYTQFSCNANGVCRLGAAAVGTTFTNSLASVTDAPKIAPYFDDLSIGSNGKIHYKVTGSAPNRKLVVEFLNMNVPRSGGAGTFVAAPGAATFQLWLFESAATTNPGVIQFVYGNGIVVNSVNSGYSVGLQSGVATNFASVTTSTNAVSYATANNTNTTAITAGTAYLFTPNIPLAPTGLTFTATSAVSTTLNFTDNATNEVGYAIYRSTDGGATYTFLAQTAANATTYTDTGLSPTTTYFYQVYAVTEGALSNPALTGSVTTIAAGNDTCAGAGGNYSTPATWADGTVPTASDNVTIQTGCAVTVDAASNALNLTIDSGGSLVGATGTTLTVGGNLTNNGTLDLSPTNTATGTGLIFTNPTSNTFSGTGATTDILTITVNKGTSSANVLELNTTNFSVQGVATDVAGFLTLTNGTFKLSGTFTVTNRVFTVAAYTIGATTGFWLNNPNFTVAGQNGSPTNNGLSRLTQGIYSIGTAIGNSLGAGAGAQFIVEGGTMNVAGRLQTTSAITYTQSAGTVNVCTIGQTAATACFGLTGVSTISMTGGTIVLVQRSTAATPLDYSVSSAPTGTIGTTLQIGNAATATNFVFSIRGNVPNMVVDNTGTAKSVLLTAQTNALGNVTLNTGTNVNLNGFIWLIIAPTITNNGTITATLTGARFYFLGNGAQTITGSGTTTLVTASGSVDLTMDNPAGLTIDPSSGGIITQRVNFFRGSITNANKLTLGNGGTTVGVIQYGLTGGLNTAGNFDVAPTFNIGSGGQINIYGQEPTSRTTGVEINPTRILNTLTVDNTNNLTIAGGDLTVTGVMTLTNGIVTTGANTLINNGTAARTNGFVVGNLSRSYTAAGAYTYFVGDNTGTPEYSPMTATVTALGINPSSLTVSVVDALLPGLNAAQSASRYWTLTENGDLTADLAFTYLDSDISGDETMYKVFRREAGVTLIYAGGNTNNAATNTATVTGVSDFSDWGIGNAPTAAGVNVGGRVVTSAGRGIAGARVYLTDGQGNVTVRQTNGLGYYRFVDVAAGGNYIMTAEHKAYKFPPSQLYFISGEELEINFVAGGGSGKSIGQEPDKRK